MVFILEGFKIETNNKAIKPDLSSQNLVVVNDREFWVEDFVYYINPNDQSRIYQTNLKNGITKKLTNETGMIIDLYNTSLYFINKATNNAIMELDLQSLKAKPVEPKFTVNGWVYFNNFINIYKVKTGGTTFLKIYSRVESGSQMEIIEIKEDWIYFNIWSEDGLSKNRIKSDGTQEEHLGTEHLD